MAKTLSGFSISRSGEDYLIRIEDDDGSKAEYMATYDQLDLMAEAVDEQLDGDEEDALAIDSDDEEGDDDRDRDDDDDKDD